MDRRSLIISLGLHVSIAVLAWIGLPSIKRDLPVEQPIVVMEIVQSVPTTNLKEGNKPNTAKQEQKARGQKSHHHHHQRQRELSRQRQNLQK